MSAPVLEGGEDLAVRWFGDVEPLENVIQYLNNLPDFADTVPTSAIPVARAVVA
ncbi:hypothetical protein [Pseudarthrobacter cellobiosi]|uniref:hypothetical protein n=1 Tax=Pseudarthrobacter cellobiosi TaxID=2953654 RepID=UPI00208FBB90|nr:hypothetical protein [Pseudarthrobacter sp. HLT1-5]MCO4255921.1 hypothetical protein [Pseudarthrobacter sp. HLT1-5]